jgi:hypothetical protein
LIELQLAPVNDSTAEHTNQLEDLSTEATVGSGNEVTALQDEPHFTNSQPQEGEQNLAEENTATAPSPLMTSRDRWAAAERELAYIHGIDITNNPSQRPLPTPEEIAAASFSRRLAAPFNESDRQRTEAEQRRREELRIEKRHVKSRIAAIEARERWLLAEKELEREYRERHPPPEEPVPTTLAHVRSTTSRELPRQVTPSPESQMVTGFRAAMEREDRNVIDTPVQGEASGPALATTTQQACSSNPGDGGRADSSASMLGQEPSATLTSSASVTIDWEARAAEQMATTSPPTMKNERTVAEAQLQDTEGKTCDMV